MSTAELEPAVHAMASMTKADIERLARALAPHLAAHLDPEALWSEQEAADYLRCSRSQLRLRFKQVPGFPRPIRLPTPEGVSPQSRWRAQEVRDWAMHHQQKGTK